MTDDIRQAVVTGAARGIGAAVAARLAVDGWRVVLADVDVERGRDVAACLGGGARFVRCDVSDEASIGALVADAAHTGPIAGLVCNAGIMIRKPLRALTLAEWSAVIATNLTATYLLVRAAEPALRAARASVVAIASTRAHQSEPDTEAYAASKGGLVALIHALAISLGPDVRVNCISPGWIDVGQDEPRPCDHAQHPAGRVGRPGDVAGLAAWLLGPDSGFATGAEFTLDGGMTRKMIYES